MNKTGVANCSIILASKSGHADVGKLLLSFGANIYDQNEFDASSIEEAFFIRGQASGCENSPSPSPRSKLRAYAAAVMVLLLAHGAS